MRSSYLVSALIWLSALICCTMQFSGYLHAKVRLMQVLVIMPELLFCIVLLNTMCTSSESWKQLIILQNDYPEHSATATLHQRASRHIWHIEFQQPKSPTLRISFKSFSWPTNTLLFQKASLKSPLTFQSNPALLIIHPSALNPNKTQSSHAETLPSMPI